MNLFELFVKIGVDDQASGAISKITQGLGAGLKNAAKIVYLVGKFAYFLKNIKQIFRKKY